MTHVVCEPCSDCKYTDCVVVCPVSCFYQDDTMLYIDPDECIDCEACIPECPVEAIFRDTNVPADWKQWTKVNAKKSAELKDAPKTRVMQKRPKHAEGEEPDRCKKKK